MWFLFTHDVVYISCVSQFCKQVAQLWRRDCAKLDTFSSECFGGLHANIGRLGIRHLSCLYACGIVLHYTEPEMPEHNLEPPRFSRRALEKILTDWTAVRAMLMTGCHGQKSSTYVDAHSVVDVVFHSLLQI